MRPIFSMILFSVLSGAGFGLLAWLGLALGMGLYVIGVNALLVTLTYALALTVVGLLVSIWHFGKPRRVWRGLIPWRNRWRTRELVAALATYVPLLALAALRHAPRGGLAVRAIGLMLAACALLTVYCAARAYTSSNPIPAWRLPQVLPSHLLMALASGGLWLWLILALHLSSRGVEVSDATRYGWLFGLLLVVLAAGLLKRSYWRELARSAPGSDTGSATRLDSFGHLIVASVPYAEADYLLRAPGFVWARRHRETLRKLALLFAFVLCALSLGLAMLIESAEIGLASVAVFSVMSGLFIERWLFFAAARHHFAVWYPGQS